MAETDDDIFLRVQGVVKKIFPDARVDITPQTAFIEDLGADSISTTEVVMAIEDEFDIIIPDEAAKDMKTVQDVVNYIRENKKK